MYSEKTETTLRIPDNRKRVLEALMKLGCKWTIMDDINKMIKFTFQGSNFYFCAKDENPAIIIYYLWWERVELYDIDEISRWRQAINNRNRESGINAFYTINKAKGYMFINSKMVLTAFTELHNLDEILKGILRQFFRNQHNITDEVHRLKVKEGD